MGGQEFFLAVNAQFVEQNVPRVTQQLGVIHSGYPSEASDHSFLSALRSAKVVLALTGCPLSCLMA